MPPDAEFVVAGIAYKERSYLPGDSFTVARGDEITLAVRVENYGDTGEVALQVYNWSLKKEHLWKEYIIWNREERILRGLDPWVDITEKFTIDDTGEFEIEFVLYNKVDDEWVYGDSSGRFYVTVARAFVNTECDRVPAMLIGIKCCYIGEEGTKNVAKVGETLNLDAPAEVIAHYYVVSDQEYTVKTINKTTGEVLDEYTTIDAEMMRSLGTISKDCKIEAQLIVNNEIVDTISFNVNVKEEITAEIIEFDVPETAVEGSKVRVYLKVKNTSTRDIDIMPVVYRGDTGEVVASDIETDISPGSSADAEDTFIMPNHNVVLKAKAKVRWEVGWEFTTVDEQYKEVKLEELPPECIDIGEGGDFIRVKVVNEIGLPIPNATVELFKCFIPVVGCPYDPYGLLGTVEYGYELKKTATTDSDGTVCFSGVNSDWDYAIAVKVDGEVRAQRRFTEPADFNRLIEVRIGWPWYYWAAVGGVIVAIAGIAYYLERRRQEELMLMLAAR